MNEEVNGSPRSRSQTTDGHVVYVMPGEPLQSISQISLAELLHTLWEGRWIVIGVTAICIVGSIVYALTATQWYRAQVLLAPAQSTSTDTLTSRVGALAGLASLAGATVGTPNAESVAMLKSRGLAREFIQNEHLLTVLLYKQWDARAGRWKDENPKTQPDIRDAVKFFDQDVRTVSEDSATNLVTLSIEWIVPQTAADWANEFVRELNDRMRKRALAEAQANVAYLERQLKDTNVDTLRQSIGSLLQSELQKVMLARGKEEFAFRVIDKAQVPKEPVRPRRLLIIALATAIGGIVSAFFVLGRHAVTRAWSSATNGQSDVGASHQ